MKIDNQDIIRMARQLRDEENAQLDVHPWSRHRRFHFPVWLAALPAATIAGFVLGLWTQAHTQSDAPLTALIDTVYIEVPASQPQQDTVIATPLPSRGGVCDISPAMSKHTAPRPTKERNDYRQPPQKSTIGRSLADDHIRYDLLVRN